MACGAHVARRGVGVTLVAPGFIKTDLTADLRFRMPGPSWVVRAIARAITRPRREVFVPGYYRLLARAAQMLPGLTDMALRWRR